jgi:biofilm PGA synthesis N-glycosyltransferase PgaC
VSGACQVFRRECYEGIGGYAAVKVGTIDCIAVITARMMRLEDANLHQKGMLPPSQSWDCSTRVMKANFYTGVMDYAMGNHPLWQFSRIIYQMTRRPIFVRGLALGMGFLWALMRHGERPVSREFITFHRREQMERLKSKVTGKSLPDDSSVLVQ